MIVICVAVSLLFGLLPEVKTQLENDDFQSSKSVSNRERLTTCSKGWFTYGDMCYRIGGKKGAGKLIWNKAEERCQEYGGHLASIHSKEQSDFIRAFLILDIKISAWIGLHDQVNESNFKWVDGSVVDFTNWEPSEPSGIGLRNNKEDCTEMIFRTGQSQQKTGLWNDLDCNRELDFICQKKKGKQARKFTDPRFCTVGSGGWRHRTSCYHVVKEKLSWTEAEDYCIKNHEGHLVTINDFTVDLFLEYVLRNYTESLWIGIKIKDEFQQQWSSGWYVSFSKWTEDSGDFTDGTCAIRTETDEWTTISCRKQLPFICEYSTVSTPVTPPSLKTTAEMYCPEEPPGWRDLGGEFCYHFEQNNHVSWPKANFMCMRRGGTLASFHSQQEVDIIHPFLRYTEFIYWLGLYRSQQYDEEFVWADGTPLDFIFWRPDEPNSEKEQCVELTTDTMKWNDKNCDDHRGFICSIRKIASNRTTESHVLTPSCSGGISINSVVGVIVCVLVVAVLLGVVVYYFRPGGEHGQARKTSGILIPTPVRDQRPKYRSAAEIVIKDDTYEDLA